MVGCEEVLTGEEGISGPLEVNLLLEILYRKTSRLEKSAEMNLFPLSFRMTETRGDECCALNEAGVGRKNQIREALLGADEIHMLGADMDGGEYAYGKPGNATEPRWVRERELLDAWVQAHPEVDLWRR